jgi:hypothetical protein
MVRISWLVWPDSSDADDVNYILEADKVVGIARVQREAIGVRRSGDK